MLEMYVWLSACLLLIAVLAVPVSRVKTGDFFSPAALFVASWCGTLGLYFLQWLPYRPMSARTFFLLVATIVIVIVASGAGRWMAVKRVRSTEPRQLSAPEIWVTVYSVIGLLGVVWYVALVARILGWSAFETGSRIRAALSVYTIPSGFLFLEYFCIAAPLLAFSLAMSGTRLRPRMLIGPAICTLATWLTTDRTQFFVVVLGVFFMWVFRRGRALSWRGLVAAGALSAVLLGSNFLIVGNWLGKTPANLGVAMRLSTRGPSVVAAGAASPTHGPAPRGPSLASRLLDRIERFSQRGTTLYLYATGSFAALDVLLEEPMGQTHGLYTVYPVARLAQRAGILDGPVPNAIPEDRGLRLRSDRDIAFNGYTFLYYPLMDFGWLGALLYAAAAGVLSGVVYGLMRAHRSSPMYLILMAHVSTALVLSVFVNKFNNTASWYVAVATLLPFVVASRRPDALTPRAQPLPG
jgi:hypothetical protein